MNILVVDIAAESGGALSVLLDFYQYVKSDKEAKKHNWKFIVSTSVLEPAEHISVDIVKKGRFPWISRLWSENKKIKKQAKKFSANIILSLQNTIIKGIKNIKQAVYVHQSIPFQQEKNFSFWKKREFKFAIYQHIIGKFISASIRNADIVFVQTNWMKRAVRNKTKCAESKIVVIPINRESVNLSNLKNQDWDNKSFFYPAFYSVYKNQELILKSAKILKSKGVEGIKITLTTNNNLKYDFIEEVGAIPHEKVLEKMQTSTLIFPSYIETVGLPLIEAMELGTVILAADCEYAHETLGQYENAYYFNPSKQDELANLIESVYNKQILKQSTHKIVQTYSAWENLLSILTNKRYIS